MILAHGAVQREITDGALAFMRTHDGIDACINDFIFAQPERLESPPIFD